MRIIAIDPGSEQSAYVVYENESIKEFGIYSNEDMLSIVATRYAECMAIEMIASYGMAVGKTVFDTCVWIGRIIQQFSERQKRPVHLVYRKDVKMYLCNSMRAKDSNIRQAIMDRYPATGGGKKPQIGTKQQPGPLYGISKDIWSALSVAITFAEGK